MAALGRPGYINLGHGADLGHKYDVVEMEAHAHAMLDAAWESGIRYYDTARSYGRGEAFLASWLRSRGIGPAEVTVGSKWGYTYTAGWQVEVEKHEVKDHTLPVYQRQIGESRELLGEYLNLYQVHSATLDSGVLEDGDVLRALAELRDSGVVVGLSLSGPRQGDTLRKALGVQSDGRPLFHSVQATWNLLVREATDALGEAHEAGMGVIIKEALANGRLTERNDDPAFADKLTLLRQTAEDAGTTVDALALAGVLARPWVDVVLSGAARTEHLMSNVGALDVVWTDEMEASLAGLAEPAEQYWAARGDMDWN